MTDRRINQLIAEHCGWNWYAVEKGGWYYRPDGHGYTNRISEAGKYSKEEANAEIVKGEPMSIVPIPFPDYCNDLNAMCKAELTLWRDECLVEKYEENLKKEFLYQVGYQGAAYWFMANANTKAVAFLKTIDKWKE